MEPKIATAIIVKHMELAKKIQDQLDLDAIDIGISNKSVLVALLIYAAALADRTHMEAFDFLQLADVAYQVIDSGGRPVA